MEVVIGNRRCGKTMYAIGYMFQNRNALMMVHTYNYKHHLEDKYPELRGRIITPLEQEFRYGRPSYDFVVDNLDLILSTVLHIPRLPQIITLTGEGVLLNEQLR